MGLLEQLAQPDERLLASGQAEEFLSVYLESQTDSVRPHIVRMMQSPHDDVRKVGARVAVTGAAGQIGYALLFRIANGDLLGKDQPVILSLLDLPVAQKALTGVIMELE